MLLLGAAIGAGVVGAFSAFAVATHPPDDLFRSVERPGIRFGDERPTTGWSGRALVIRVGSSFANVSRDQHQLERDLAVTGRTLDDYAIHKAAVPAGAVVATMACAGLLAAAGVAVGPIWPVVFAIAAAGVGFVLPDMQLQAEARARRVAFRHALSAYLDLVTVIMSGGGGLLTALHRAADAGEGWAFAEIRAALDRARLSNRTAWSQLAVLGDRFEIPELRDLVAAAELAGSEGARISESIATKSDVLRARLQAEVERTSESLTEQMLLPVGLLLVALFLFLGFAVFQQLGQGDAPFVIEQAWLDTVASAGGA